MQKELSVGEVARRSGVAVSALHFYETRGLIRSNRTGGNSQSATGFVFALVGVVKTFGDFRHDVGRHERR